MTALQGTIKDGQIILDTPAALSEGTRVEVLPIEGARTALGMRDRQVGARWLRPNRPLQM